MKYLKFGSPLFLLLGFFVSLLALWFWKREFALFHKVEYLNKRLSLITMGLIFLGLSGPMIFTRTWKQCVLFLVDVSESINDEERRKVKDYLRIKAREKGPENFMGVLQFAGETDLLVPPEDIPERTLLENIAGWKAPEVGLGYTNIEGAVQLAANVLPENLKKRIVLITDGNENIGKAANLYGALKARQIKVDVLPVGGIHHNEVLVESAYVPAKVSKGIPFSGEIFLASNIKTKGKLEILIDGESAQERKIDISPGKHRLYQFPMVLQEGGFHSIRVRLSAKKDTIFMNNSVETTTFVVGPPKALFVSLPYSKGSDDPKNRNGHYLQNVLEKNGIVVDSLSWKHLSPKVEDYDSYEAVILNNIPSSYLRPEQMQAISSAVHDLGVGLIFVGGGRSTGPMGYNRTPIEKALPVKLGPSTGKDDDSMELVLVVDKSGSMSEGEEKSKFRMAINATQSIIEILGEEDQMGVIAFDNKYHVIANPGKIKTQPRLINNIYGLKPGGRTDFFPALLQAYDWLKTSTASQKHILLLSDGRTRKRDFKGLAQKMVDKDITISVIGIGVDINTPLLKEIAERGHGRFFEVTDELHDLEDIFKMDTLMVSTSLAVEETFAPQLKDPDPILSGIPHHMPKMHGYMVTSRKQSAVIPVVSHRGDPIVGFWRYGIGKAGIYTGDDGFKWSRDWVSWQGFGKLWLQLVKRVMRPPIEKNPVPTFQIQGNRVDIKYEMEQGKGPPGVIVARMIPSAGKTSDLRLIQSSAGKYHGAMDDLKPGRYLTVIRKETQSGTREIGRGNFSIGGNSEFLQLNKNMALLKELSAQTGGKVLSMDDPIFVKEGEAIKQYSPVWPYLFLSAVLIFLFDIAQHRGFFLTHQLKIKFTFKKKREQNKINI